MGIASLGRSWAQNADALPLSKEAGQESVAVDNPISIEANVVEIVLNDEHREGVDWSAIVSDFHTVPLKKEDNPIWADKKYRLSVGIVSNEDYAVLLEALDTVGHVSQSPQPTLSLNARTNADEIFNDHLRVKASIARQRVGDPRLSIEPYLSLTPNEGKGPHRLGTPLALKAQTETALRDNMTIVIGGIFKEEAIIKTRKFPLLGSLPLVGMVFRSQGHWVQKTETVIFLTMRLTPSPDANADAANAHN